MWINFCQPCGEQFWQYVGKSWLWEEARDEGEAY
jgi:hypothetical protein